MKDKDIAALVRPNILSLAPYSTARDEYKGKLGIFIDANESPYDTGWNRYPDPRQTALKAKIAPIKGVAPSNIFLGNGSDEAIDLVYRVFCVPGRDNVVAIVPSYGMYTVSAAINDVEVREVALGEDFSLDVEKLLAATDANTKAIFLCSPNNPSGNSFPRAQIEAVLTRFRGIVVVDEAYIDFSPEESLLKVLGDYPNLLVLQTFSKAWGLAALRLGLAFASEFIIGIMSNVKYPYNINESTQRLALEALSSPIDERVEEIKSEREILSGMLPGYSFVEKVYPSDANFILVKVRDADELYNHLILDGIIVRNRTRVRGCANCLRITVGTKYENIQLLKSLNEYEKGNIRR